MMDKESKIFVAGSAGMVGSAIVRRLLHLGYSNVVGSVHKRAPQTASLPSGLRTIALDLMRQEGVAAALQAEKPDYVFIAAARVGGIHANITYPAQFIHNNLVIQINLMHTAYAVGVKRLLFLGSSCIYPKLAPQPMREEYLLTGLLEPTNEAYAIAKIAGIKMCEAYNRQYGTRFMAVMPTNLYGPNDNFDLEDSHVLPALMRKLHEAKVNGDETVTVWGTGSPRREFLHVDDMADASVFVMNLDDALVADALLSYPKPCFLNVGCGEDCTIGELAEIIKTVVGFEGELVFDTTKPDGAPQKLLDISRIKALGWQPKIAMEDGIREVYEWYVRRVSKPRG
jgi:GDP-L-fucose synthase